MCLSSPYVPSQNEQQQQLSVGLAQAAAGLAQHRGGRFTLQRNARALGCLLTLPWLCCLQFKNPPDYSEMHLSPAQFEQYKLHADADRTAKMHSAVNHRLQVSVAQQSCSAMSAGAWQ